MIAASDVSVIIPTRDRRRLLRRALDSTLSQSARAGEVIVVDDGSTDETAQMLQRDYPVVRCLRQSCRGVSAARNRGIRSSKGRWIAFLDSDDAWHPDKLARQIEALVRRAGHLVCHTDELWIRDGVRVNPRQRHAKPEGWVFDACLPLCCMSPSSVLLHRSVLDHVGLFDESLPACEDYDLWLRIAARYPVLLVKAPLVVKYGGHEDQLSRRYWGMDRFRIRSLEKLLAAGFLDREQNRLTRDALCDRIEIYLAGARKRRRVEEVEILTDKLRRLRSTRDRRERGA